MAKKTATSNPIKFDEDTGRMQIGRNHWVRFSKALYGGKKEVIRWYHFDGPKEGAASITINDLAAEDRILRLQSVATGGMKSECQNLWVTKYGSVTVDEATAERNRKRRDRDAKARGEIRTQSGRGKGSDVEEDSNDDETNKPAKKRQKPGTKKQTNGGTKNTVTSGDKKGQDVAPDSTDNEALLDDDLFSLYGDITKTFPGKEYGRVAKMIQKKMGVKMPPPTALMRKIRKQGAAYAADDAENILLHPEFLAWHKEALDKRSGQGKKSTQEEGVTKKTGQTKNKKDGDAGMNKTSKKALLNVGEETAALDGRMAERKARYEKWLADREARKASATGS